MADRLLVATRKGLFRFYSQDSGWSAGPPAFLGEPVTAVLSDGRDGTLYSALRLGHFGVKLHRSDDGGDTWTELPAPAFPPDPAPSETAPIVDMIWTLAAGGAAEPGVLWAGTLTAALFRSGDRGDSWSLVEGLWNVPERSRWFGGGYDLPGVHSIHVDPRDGRRMTAAISCGGVWQSDDGATTWRQAGLGLRSDYLPPDKALDPTNQDPHRLSHCPADPDVVWCQHHNGIFRSTDGGATFTEITSVKPSVFGFAVAAHPRDPQTAWFVPAVKDECRVPVDGRLVVTRTSDGGRGFASLGDGLPATGSYDLVYRHALDVDDSSARLAIGSTTGNLWTSEDGGDHWTLVSAHLPPIAQVAFG